MIDAELVAAGGRGAGREAATEDTIGAAMERHLTRYFADFGDGLPPPGLYHRILREVEHPLLTAALAATRGNQIRAADLLGRQPQHAAQEDPRSGYPGDPDERLSDPHRRSGVSIAGSGHGRISLCVTAPAEPGFLAIDVELRAFCGPTRRM